MPVLDRALIAGASLALWAPQLAGAAEQPGPLNLSGIGRYASREQVSTAGEFTDLRPTDWAYQALTNLVERYGCVAGYAQGNFKGSRTISRFEAAALLNSCLDRISDSTDTLRRLLREFEQELATLKGRTDGLGARVGALEASQFSSTTKLSGQATFVVGANAFGGIASDSLQQQARGLEGGTTFNYDLQLDFDTSFTGSDLFRIKVRAGNFANSGFGGGAVVGTNNAAIFPNQLEIAFQEDCAGNSDPATIDCGDVVGIQRAFYQFPIGNELTATVGGLVRQDDMLAIWPSVYPADTLLDYFSYAGAPGAYNSNLGPGAGLWWKRGNWNLSLNYIAGNGDTASEGGIGTVASAQTSTVQLGYATESFGIAGAYTYSRNVGVASGTPLAVLEVSAMNSIGVSAFWQPSNGGWLPSISTGWGVNTHPGASPGDINVLQTQSWYVGLQWDDVLISGNKAGFAVGQPTFVTRCGEGCPTGSPQDGQYAWEWWYSFQISDNLTVTPALFYLSNLLGQITKIETGSNAGSLANLGGLVKTTFRF